MKLAILNLKCACDSLQPLLEVVPTISQVDSQEVVVDVSSESSNEEEGRGEMIPPLADDH